MKGRLRDLMTRHRPAPHDEPGPGISKQVLRDLLGPSAVVVEAGAHNGSDTAELAELFPDGHIHAFEPVDALRSELALRMGGVGNVSVYPYALWSSGGTMTMNLSGGSSDASSSLLVPKEHLEVHPSVTFQTAVEVPTIGLDVWSERYAVRRVDLLWLDLQGAELEVLASAPRLLGTVRAIYSEVNFQELYQGAGLYPQLRAVLAAHGFRVSAEDLRWKDAGNALFVRD